MAFAELGRRLRLGMVGGGPGSLIGPVHRVAARLDDRWELCAGAFSSNAERSARTGRETFVAPERCYGRWEEMIEREQARPAGSRLDAIAIVTPNHLHAGPAIAALDAGFHVICDKPLAATLADAEAIAAAVERSGRTFVLTHTYTGYPMVRQMRAMARAGTLGRLRVTHVQYAQDWLAKPIEKQGHAQAAWRVDPARSGAGGCVGDIGTHAFHLAAYTTGLQAEAICADLSAFGEGRVLDDNVHMLLRYPGGVRGMLWASQVATGKGNGIRLGLYGEAGGVEWFQEQPNQLRYTAVGEAPVILDRAGPGPVAAAYAPRTAPFHPEGYLEAFAQLYADAAEVIAARERGADAPEAADGLPGIADGVEGMRFVAAAVESSRRQAWLSRKDWG
ncbi:MAG: Gfo/Idh/MocA family oxidoreductase [Gluconacetobacter diazotrophicus]|nr:Gfo/Idh/MocA family oxidoreductase [Gluconacetobacter diazotrophicus]